jgi:hypothetical protein
VSAIVLFLMFLVPAKSDSGGRTGSNHHIVFQWELDDASPTVRIDLYPPGGDMPIHIWSKNDTYPRKSGDCLGLSKDPRTEACGLSISDDETGGIFFIQDPKPGEWNAKVEFADRTDGFNGDGSRTVNFRMTVVGKLAVQVDFGPIGVGTDAMGDDLKEVANNQGLSREIADALTVGE